MALAHLLKDATYRIARALWRPQHAAVVLAYHSISDSKGFGTVASEVFAAQMRYLHEARCNVVSLSELARMREARAIAPKTVCITFDDGYRDNYTNALPVLKQYGFPATIFIVASWIGNNENVYRGESLPLLSERELRELASSGLIALEPHTMTHGPLTALSGEQAEREIHGSKETLERMFGKECLHLAYPKGYHSASVREAAQRAGIHCAYTTEEGVVRAGDDPYALHRNGINRTVSLQEFKGTVRFGRLSRARFLKRFRGR